MTPIKIFIDTSFIIALINERDQYHNQALSVADQYDTQLLVVTDSVLLEVANALSRRYKIVADIGLRLKNPVSSKKCLFFRQIFRQKPGFWFPVRPGLQDLFLSNIQNSGNITAYRSALMTNTHQT